MNFTDIKDALIDEYNHSVDHPLQAYEWGEFRKKTGIKVIRRGILKNNKITNSFQLTIHKIPKTKTTVGYLPKGVFPNAILISELKRVGKEENCAYIQLEPNVAKFQIQNSKFKIDQLRPSFHPLFTKNTFILDLTKSEEELLKKMHQKTRYNIKVAQKHGVKIAEDNSDKAFAAYVKLTRETAKRQKFYAHDEKYHKLMWQTLRISTIEQGNSQTMDPNRLQAHLLKAAYKQKILVAWVLFSFKDTLYYPYGASSSENKEVMASTLMMWEAIKLGKRLGLKKFDMWGSLGPDPSPSDSWYGFHLFKQRFGGELVELMGSFDLVINPLSYRVLSVADKLRWAYLKFRKI